LKNLELKVLLPASLVSVLLYGVGLWKLAPTLTTIASVAAMIILAILGVTAYVTSRHLGALLLAVTGVWLLLGPSLMRFLLREAIESGDITRSQAGHASTFITYALLILVAWLFRISKRKQAEEDSSA